MFLQPKSEVIHMHPVVSTVLASPRLLFQVGSLHSHRNYTGHLPILTEYDSCGLRITLPMNVEAGAIISALFF